MFGKLTFILEKKNKRTDLLLHVPLARLISPFSKYVYRSWKHFPVTTASLFATAASSSPRVIGWLPCPSTSSGKSAIPSWRASGGASATIIRYWTHLCADVRVNCYTWNLPLDVHRLSLKKQTVHYLSPWMCIIIRIWMLCNVGCFHYLGTAELHCSKSSTMDRTVPVFCNCKHWQTRSQHFLHIWGVLRRWQQW